MNSKVSFFNFKYLKENMKKSRGIMFLFLLIIPIFTYLLMLLQNNNNACNSTYGCNSNLFFPDLVNLSIPAIIFMYIAPFVIAVSLFSYLFKKDSVDFINTLPLKRSTIYITNIIGGIAYFFFIFLITSIIMMIGSIFFDNLVIHSGMYFHFFITFFIAYTYTFLASCFTLTLTGSRMVHVALTLIVLFIPGFITDFYNSRVYDDNRSDNFYYSACGAYDTNCSGYFISNDFSIDKSYRITNGQTLPYKYISVVPRTMFNMSKNEIAYSSELANVYNLKSILRMIFLSIVYFALGLYIYIRRKMEIAETTFKSENVHQIVKCLTLFPVCLGTISLFAISREIISLWIMGAITVTIYIVYDLITHRNNGNIAKSVIYFSGLVMATLIIYLGFDGIASLESKRVIKKDEVSNVGVLLDNSFNQEKSIDFNVLKHKITDQKVIDLIFDNANKNIPNVEEKTKRIAIRLKLDNGAEHYFNMNLMISTYDKLLALLDKNNGYAKSLKNIPYDKIYGVKLGNVFQGRDVSNKIVDLIKDGYEKVSVSDIVNNNYLDPYEGEGSKYNMMVKLYVYDDIVKIYDISTMINPKLINYVIQMSNNQYIKDIKNKNININRLSINMEFNYLDDNTSEYDKYVNNNQNLLYRYINDNVKGDIDFSKYAAKDIAYITVYLPFEDTAAYQVYIPKDDNYNKLLETAKALDSKDE